MRRLLILILFIPGLLSAQNEQPAGGWPPASVFSTCDVTLTASPSHSATVRNGLVEDVNRNQWALPPLATVPQGDKITVKATSKIPGAITALPGQIRVIVTPTAGWISVVNASAAVPGQPIEVRCQQAVRSITDHLFALELPLGGCINCFTGLVRVYSDGKIDAYVDQRSLDRARAYRVSGNFQAHLYFVYRDESARQQAIATIGKKILSRCQGPCLDKLQNLKYIMMDVAYSRSGIFGVVTPDGQPVPGPVLHVDRSLYLAPLGCDADDYRLRPDQWPGWPSAENEIIRASSERAVGDETYSFVDGYSGPHWSLLLGDLVPLRTKIGFQAINISRERTPLLFEVVLAVNQKIQEGPEAGGSHP